MAQLRIGTASWTDKSLIACKRFYPRGASTPAARLAYYASQFAAVEVDSSYYAMPSAYNAQQWVERTPADFVFHIKAFRALTHHQTPRVALPPAVREALPGETPNVYYKDMPAEVVDALWADYRRGIAPLRAAGRLGAVHFQFAPWVTFGPPAFAHIEACIGQLPDVTLSVEFRHRSWFAPGHHEATLRFLSDHGLVHTVVDEPQGFANSVPAVWAITNPSLAVVRFHGRNTVTWNQKGHASSGDRFNYDYSDEELRELAEQMRRHLAGAQNVAAFFNNNYEDQGQRNARTLMEIFGVPRPADRLA
ncbi:hypothetical protein PTE30175_04520 [Pandoraea terrae]|uniref:DUF72 domain-containing protein n=1 Tax=Pandoraea terrae TaxID=1537710 RepID=A0A5E4YM35_9BURK|nr:DUF72 domain-containing protein [Pandoraea terrae]VVE49811.1 hypothetical protein PTE30175_04520 [Pandoraea terrae]